MRDCSPPHLIPRVSLVYLIHPLHQRSFPSLILCFWSPTSLLFDLILDILTPSHHYLLRSCASLVRSAMLTMEVDWHKLFSLWKFCVWEVAHRPFHKFMFNQCLIFLHLGKKPLKVSLEKRHPMSCFINVCPFPYLDV